MAVIRIGKGQRRSRRGCVCGGGGARERDHDAMSEEGITKGKREELLHTLKVSSWYGCQEGEGEAQSGSGGRYI